MPEAQAVPKPQDKLKKVEWYAAQLVGQAVSKEKEGRTGDAIVDYLQAADLLLLLAKQSPDYPRWKALTDRATSCQKRVKALTAAKKQASDEKLA